VDQIDKILATVDLFLAASIVASWGSEGGDSNGKLLASQGMDKEPDLGFD